MGNNGGVFWTFCPYCFYVYCYDKVYEGYSLRCQNVGCRRAFHGVCLSRMELDKGEGFGCFGFFPLGFSPAEGDSKAKFENWSPIVGLFPVERMENACDGRVSNDGGDEVLDDSDELEQDVYGHESGEKRKVTSRKKMVPRTAKKLRTRRRISNEGGAGGGGNVAGQGLDFDGDVGNDDDVASGSGYGRDSENMNFFEEDGEVFMRFGSDDTAF